MPTEYPRYVEAVYNDSNPSFSGWFASIPTDELLDVRAVLVNALGRLAPDTMWVTGNYALDADGQPTASVVAYGPDRIGPNPRAIGCCVWGHINQATTAVVHFDVYAWQALTNLTGRIVRRYLTEYRRSIWVDRGGVDVALEVRDLSDLNDHAGRTATAETLTEIISFIDLSLIGRGE